jgi:hypothetical protein
MSDPGSHLHHFGLAVHSKRRQFTAGKRRENHKSFFSFEPCKKGERASLISVARHILSFGALKTESHSISEVLRVHE